LVTKDDEDIGEKLIGEGLASVIRRKEKRLQPLVTKYLQAETQARKNHVSLLLIVCASFHVTKFHE
jgi:endonuclease YncB( thermonuclease family)